MNNWVKATIDSCKAFNRFQITRKLFFFFWIGSLTLFTQNERASAITDLSLLPKIVQVDFETLRHAAQPIPVDEIRSPKIQSLIQTMVDVMRTAPGVGLAAPQIGESLQVIVLEDQESVINTRLTAQEADARKRFGFPLKVIINPKLTLIPSEKGLLKTAKFAEGCLSVEGYMAEVERAFEVKVEGWDQEGNPFEWQVAGWPARILQHEVDHLNGVIYIDRMDRKTFQPIPQKFSNSNPNQPEKPTLPSILSTGDPRLRIKAEPVAVDEIQSPELQQIVSTMIQVIRAQPLVGMAAPQIGILKQIIVLEDRQEYIDAKLSLEEREKRERFAFPLKIIINPKLTFIHSSSGPQSAIFPEGSPCIRNYQGSVERHLEVKVEGWDENGKPFEWQVRGWPARILQHEVDHLNGILYIDRMDSKTFKRL